MSNVTVPMLCEMNHPGSVEENKNMFNFNVRIGIILLLAAHH